MGSTQMEISLYDVWTRVHLKLSRIHHNVEMAWPTHRTVRACVCWIGFSAILLPVILQTSSNPKTEGHARTIGRRVSHSLRNHIHPLHPHLRTERRNTKHSDLSLLGFLFWFHLCGCPTTTQASPRHIPARQAPNITSPHQRTSLTSVAFTRFLDAMTITITSRIIPQNKNGNGRCEIKTEYGFDLHSGLE